MQFNKPVSNPVLVGTIELMMKENTTEHKKMLAEEILKATYLCPAFVQPDPIKDEHGVYRLQEKASVQIPTLATPDEKLYFLAFTDLEELHKWKSEEDCPYTFACNFDDMVSFLSKKNKEGNCGPAVGFVINPYGCNYIVDRDMVANMLLSRELAYMNQK